MVSFGADIGDLNDHPRNFLLNVQIVRKDTGTLEMRINRTRGNQRRSSAGLTEGRGHGDIARKIHRKREGRIDSQV